MSRYIVRSEDGTVTVLAYTAEAARAEGALQLKTNPVDLIVEEYPNSL
jgi:hypothetical protein